jgi:sarcosine oxidase delta subunit
LLENWYCSSGCRRHFKIERHTLTGELRAPVLPGRKPGATQGDMK